MPSKGQNPRLQDDASESYTTRDCVPEPDRFRLPKLSTEALATEAFQKRPRLEQTAIEQLICEQILT